jgi:hypothetical protein
MAEVSDLLGVLPPFTNQSILIESVQEVADIIQEVEAAHNYFAFDYENIYQFFQSGSLKETCERLFDFCKENVRYEIEGQRSQSTKSPAALLAMGYGDCKHYAGFIAGVLSAISRNTGHKINWCYRFASYDFFNDEPGHVFVVVKDGKDSYWIDPVLSGFDERLEPTYFIDKKVSLMPLYRVSGIGQPVKEQDYFSSALDIFGIDGADNRESVGVIPPELIEAGIETSTAITEMMVNEVKALFADQVANYPVEKQSTFDSLAASVMEHVGTVAPLGVFRIRPATVGQAYTMLQKAVTRKAEEGALGHGYGDGVGWDTLQMLYDETILSLENLIAIASGKSTVIPTNTSFPGGSSIIPSVAGIDPAIISAVAGLATYFITKKLMVSAAVGIGVYLLTKKSQPVYTQPVTQYPGAQYPGTQYPTTQPSTGIVDTITDVISDIPWGDIFGGSGSGSNTSTDTTNSNEVFI